MTKPKTYIVALLALLVAYSSSLNAQGTSSQTIKLRQGWNAISFLAPNEDSLSSLPIEVKWLVVFREPEVLVANLQGSTGQFEYKKLLPEQLVSEFTSQKDLDLASVKPHEGCLVFSKTAMTINAEIKSLDNLAPVEISDKWQLVGFPAVSYTHLTLPTICSV